MFLLRAFHEIGERAWLPAFCADGAGQRLPLRRFFSPLVLPLTARRTSTGRCGLLARRSCRLPRCFRFVFLSPDFLCGGFSQPAWKSRCTCFLRKPNRCLCFLFHTGGKAFSVELLRYAQFGAPADDRAPRRAEYGCAFS